MNVPQKPRRRDEKASGEAAVAGAGQKPKGESPRQYQKASYQDVLDAPPYKVAEVVDGRLYTHSRPAPPHARAGSSLGAKIGEPFDRGKGSPGAPGGWWILDEPELHFGGSPGADILVPDVAGWRRERMPACPDTAYFTVAPDWVCEVLSPSTRKLDVGRKRDIYAREGIPYLWFIDPEPRTLEAFELRGGQWETIATLADDALVSLPPFDAIAFPLDSLWWPRS